jgi:hypothetical protein
MRIIRAVAIGILFLLSTGAVQADPPNLEDGVYIYDGASPLAAGYMSAPTVIDWNNDGKKDLLVGHFDQGHISLHLNQGTDANPVFNGGALIESNGLPITTSFG